MTREHRTLLPKPNRIKKQSARPEGSNCFRLRTPKRQLHFQKLGLKVRARTPCARVSPMVLVDRLALWYRVHDGNASKQAARLLKNVTKCLNANLRQESLAASLIYRHIGASFIYGCIGHNVVKQAGLRSGATYINSVGTVIREMWRWFLCNPRVGFWFFRDALSAIGARNSTLPLQARDSLT